MPQSEPGGACVLRRIHPLEHDSEFGGVAPGAFELKKRGGGYEDGLSVFEAASGPDHALSQLLISQDVSLRNAIEQGDEKSRSRIERWFDLNGRSVTELRAKGWAVAEIEVHELERRGFQLGPPDMNAHLEVFGSSSDGRRQIGAADQFQLHAPDLANLASKRGLK